MDRPTLRARHAIAALAGVAGLGGSLLAVGFTPEFVVAGVAAGLLVFIPGVLIAAGISALGALGKTLLTVGASLLTLLLYAGLTLFAIRLADDSGWRRSGRAVLTAGFVALATLVLSESLVGSLGAGLAAGAVVLAGSDLFSRPGVSDARRRVLRAGSIAIGIVGLGAVFRIGGSASIDDTPASEQVQSLLATADERSFRLKDLEGLVSDSFYKVDIGSADPNIGPAAWTLTVSGDVAEETVFSYDDIRARPAEHRFVTLRCVSDKPNARLMDTALWTGVPIADLLDDAGAPETCCVTLRAADGYFVSFERSALDPGLLAYEMNGKPLPRGHGSPLRTLVPGRWGETNAKWLTDIEVVTEPGEGYWENRGWQGTGEVHTVAKLHSVASRGGTITVGGHAYAGLRGIQNVEVSTDGGETWNDAELSDTLPGTVPVDDGSATPTESATATADSEEAMDAWRMWKYEYEATGKHEVVVRATDGTGALQTEEDRDAYPSGATGWVRKTVTP